MNRGSIHCLNLLPWVLQTIIGQKNTDICPVEDNAVERTYDQTLVESYLKKTQYDSVMAAFQNRLWIAKYSKGEFISSPLHNDPLFQIVVKGALSIYCIRDNGTVHSLSSGHEDYLIGDMEIFSHQISNVYAEADEDLVCLALPIEENGEKLLQNVRFLRLICKSFTNKMEALTTIDAAPADLKQRILTYMEYRCSSNEIRGLQQAAFHLNCSPRQLQRILNQYEEEGVVVKIGKGSYKLLGPRTYR